MLGLLRITHHLLFLYCRLHSQSHHSHLLPSQHLCLRSLLQQQPMRQHLHKWVLLRQRLRVPMSQRVHSQRQPRLRPVGESHFLPVAAVPAGQCLRGHLPGWLLPQLRHSDLRPLLRQLRSVSECLCLRLLRRRLHSQRRPDCLRRFVGLSRQPVLLQLRLLRPVPARHLRQRPLLRALVQGRTLLLPELLLRRLSDCLLQRRRLLRSLSRRSHLPEHCLNLIIIII